MNKSDGGVKGLGEVSMRVRNLDVMQKFYEEVVRLEVLRREESFVFFKIAAGYGGHTQILALFDAAELDFLENKTAEIRPETSTLHHIAFNIALEDEMCLWLPGDPSPNRMDALVWALTDLMLEPPDFDWDKFVG